MSDCFLAIPLHQVSSELFHFIHELWMKEVPIAELE